MTVRVIHRLSCSGSLILERYRPSLVASRVMECVTCGSVNSTCGPKASLYEVEDVWLLAVHNIFFLYLIFRSAYIRRPRRLNLTETSSWIFYTPPCSRAAMCCPPARKRSPKSLTTFC